MSNEKTLSKLKKLLALARQGEGGEKDNAERMLNKLISKHGITLEDLGDETEETNRYEFKYLNKYEEKLLFQIVAMVRNKKGTSYFQNVGARSRLEIELTFSQKCEIDLAYELLKPSMYSVFDDAFSALIHVNHIFPETQSSDKEEKPLSPEERQKLMRISGIMMGIEKTPLTKQLKG